MEFSSLSRNINSSGSTGPKFHNGNNAQGGKAASLRQRALYCSLVVQSLSHVWLFAAPWTVAHQAPLSKRFPRQEYRKVLPFSSPGDPPDPGIAPVSLMSPALAGRFFTTEPPVAHGFSCSWVCGILSDQESNQCPLHWQVFFFFFSI